MTNIHDVLDHQISSVLLNGGDLKVEIEKLRREHPEAMAARDAAAAARRAERDAAQAAEQSAVLSREAAARAAADAEIARIQADPIVEAIRALLDMLSELRPMQSPARWNDARRKVVVALDVLSRKG